MLSTDYFKQLFYTTSLFTVFWNRDILILEIGLCPERKKEMIRNTFMLVTKSEYQDLSLCSFQCWLRIPSTCPYETDYKATVIRTPE